MVETNVCGAENMEAVACPRDFVGISRVELLRRIIRFAGERVVFAEVGVWKGELAEQLLEMPEISSYHLIDPWRPMPEWNKPFNVGLEEFKAVHQEALHRTQKYEAKRVLRQGTTVEACQSIADSTIDIAYIDGDHTMRGVLLDLVSMFPKVREGGFLVGDDAVPNPWQHGAMYEPSFVYPICRHLAEAWSCPIFMVSENQFVIQKTPEKGYHFHDTTGLYKTQAVLPFLEPKRKN